MSLLTLDQFLSETNTSTGTGVGMYLMEKGQGQDDMMIQHQNQMILSENSGGEEQSEIKQPKKRAETWVQEETLSLIALRREMDGHFNTSKSNRHLWEQISAKMREKGFDRSPTMCTDKWRNLLKEFKKAKHHSKGSGPAKMSYYKELDELLKERNKNASYKSPVPTASVIATPGGTVTASKVDSYLQFSDKGFDDPSLPFGSAEGSGRSTLSMDGHLETDRHTLAITAAEAVGTNGTNPWNWRDTPTTGEDNQASFLGRVILVKWGEYTKRIGIDGTSEAIKEAIRCAFGLRTKRAFWLEDEDDVVRSFDREMPVGTYTLHLDEGLTIKICTFDETDRLPVQTEERTLYTEGDFRDFLSRRGWIGLRELSGFRCVDSLDDLCPNGMYQGVRLMGD